MKSLKLLILLFCFSACMECTSTTIQVRKYYLVESTMTLSTRLMGITQPFDYTAEIRDFKIAEPYQDLRIPLRSETNELIYYFYHFWAIKPGEGVTRFVQDLLLQSGIFQQCTRLNTGQADYIFSGEIITMERLRIKKSEYSHIAGKLVMTEGKTGKPLIQYSFDRQVELKKKKSMNAFAEAMSKQLFDETEEFLFRVADYFLYPQ